MNRDERRQRAQLARRRRFEATSTPDVDRDSYGYRIGDALGQQARLGALGEPLNVAPAQREEVGE